MSFATFNIESQIFFRSTLTYGLVNLKPIVPGHILLIPHRIVPRFSDLSPDEVSDLFLSAQRVSRVLASAYGGSGTTLSMQDGPVAGQSVPHVHVHLLPRKPEDFKANDEVYEVLDREESGMMKEWGDALQRRAKFSAVDDEGRKPRTMEEMETEARWLSGFF